MIKVDTGSNLIARYDDVIPKNVCDQIVKYVISNTSNKKNLNGSLPWFNSDTIPFVDVRDDNLKKIIDTYRFLFTQLVLDHYKQFVYPHFTDIVVWRKGMKMDFHRDNGYDGDHENQFRVRTYSMVAYLNDDYLGGETVVKLDGQPDYISTPKQGSVVIFKSNHECIHGVNKVVEGTRVTMPTWFSTGVESCETMRGFADFRVLK